jgi:hypothetical protein
MPHPEAEAESVWKEGITPSLSWWNTSPSPPNGSRVIPADRLVGYWPFLFNPTDMEDECEEIFTTGKHDTAQVE